MDFNNNTEKNNVKTEKMQKLKQPILNTQKDSESNKIIKNNIAKNDKDFTPKKRVNKNDELNDKKPANKSPNKFIIFLKENWLNLLIAFGGVLIIGLSAGLLTDTNSEWFVNLAKPVFYPPNIVFTIVWSVLYILLGVILFLLLKNKQGNKATYLLFGINGLLNILWCLIFFRVHSLFFSMLVLAGNFIAGVLLYVSIQKQNKKLSYFIIPYLVWLAFAFVLNYLIYLLN